MKEKLIELLPEMIGIRQQIHANPELAHEEHSTAALVRDRLIRSGYEVTQGIAGTGLSAVLDSGRPGKTVALRADMDALPIQEETELPYQSKNAGIMHACGHDGHTATLLAVACTLAQCTEQFVGKIKFIFQPAEETGTGAAAMIGAGILANPRVDAIFGYHNTPKSEVGVFKTRQGCIHASQDVFALTIHGKGGHAAQPQSTIDPIYIGSLIIQALQGMVSRMSTPAEPLVLSITQFHAGTTHNVIPSEALLNGTLRAVTAKARVKAKEQLELIVKSIAVAYGAGINLQWSLSFAPTINSVAETELAYNTAQQLLGVNQSLLITEASMASEDFSCYLEHIPGCFFWVGTGYTDLNMHNPHYEFNDAIVPTVAELLATIAINYLNTAH